MPALRQCQNCKYWFKIPKQVPMFFFDIKLGECTNHLLVSAANHVCEGWRMRKQKAGIVVLHD